MIPHYQLTTTDLIRRVALHHLIGYPEGIQTVQLRKLVEDSLSEYLPVSNHKNATRFKNCIWNLERIFPEYVEKIVLGHKNVLMRPTVSLFKDVDQLQLPDFESFFANKFSLEQIQLEVEQEKQTNDIASSMRELIYELADVIKNSNYYRAVEKTKVTDGLYDFSRVFEKYEDAMLFAHLTSIVSMVEKAIDDLFDED